MFSALPLLIATVAHAGPFSPKSMQGDWPTRQVDREQVLPKGWVQVGLSASHKSTMFYRDADGLRQQWGYYNAEGTLEGGTAWWTYQQAVLEVDQGFSRFVTLYVRAPMVRANLQNELDANITTIARGDIRGGLLIQPWLARTVTGALRLELKGPSGLEWPSNTVGGPAHTEGFLTGTGVTNITARLEGRAHLGIAALDASAGYTLKPPAVVGYVVQTDGFGNGWLNPGDDIHGRLGATVNLGSKLALDAWGAASYRTSYFSGVSGAGVARLDLYWMEGAPEGLFVDVGGGASFAPGEHTELRVDAAWQAMGANTQLFAGLGLEEFSPQPGLTLSGTARVRW